MLLNDCFSILHCVHILYIYYELCNFNNTKSIYTKCVREREGEREREQEQWLRMSNHKDESVKQMFICFYYVCMRVREEVKGKCVRYIRGLLESRECWETSRINSIYKIHQPRFQLHLAMLSYVLHGYFAFIIFMSGACVYVYDSDRDDTASPAWNHHCV